MEGSLLGTLGLPIPASEPSPSWSDSPSCALFLLGRLDGQKTGRDGLVARSPEQGVRTPGSQLVPATAPRGGPGEAPCPLCVSILPTESALLPGCGWWELSMVVPLSKGWAQRSADGCGERDGSGGLLTAVSLVQAVGAVLDPVAGRHTESIHRAEELSGAGWTGRAPLGHTSPLKHVQTRRICVLMCVPTRMPVYMGHVDIHVWVQARSIQAGMYEYVHTSWTRMTAVHTWAHTKLHTFVHTSAQAHSHTPLASFSVLSGTGERQGEAAGGLGVPAPPPQSAHTHDPTGCTSCSAPARRAP